MGVNPESSSSREEQAVPSADTGSAVRDPAEAIDRATSAVLAGIGVPAANEDMPVIRVHGPAQEIEPESEGGAAAVALDEPPAAGDDFLDPEFEPVVHQSVLESIRLHGEEDTTVEVCGVLVGRIYENNGAALVYVDDIVRGSHAAGRNSAVTFTADTWAHIDREMDERHPGKRIVGWYHTHPGFGIFLSEMDLFIQRHFFNAPWQTAFVYDPQSEARGMFGWRGGKTVKIDFAVDEGRGPDHARPERQAASVDPAEGSHGDAVPGTITDMQARIDALESRQRWLVAGIAVMALVAIIWPMVMPVVMPALDRGAGGTTDSGRLVVPDVSTGNGPPSPAAAANVASPGPGSSADGNSPAPAAAPGGTNNGRAGDVIGDGQ